MVARFRNTEVVHNLWKNNNHTKDILEQDTKYRLALREQQR